MGNTHQTYTIWTYRKKCKQGSN